MQNFLIFGEKVEIDFTGVGIRYIYGENLDIIEKDLASTEEVDERDISSGSGKSTLPIGLLYAKYGIVWKKDKIPLGRVINKKHKKNCEVTLEFDKDGKDIYTIKRYREFKPYGNTVYLFKWNETTQAWDDLSCADSDETQEKIDKIIGVNYITAMKTILFSRDEVKDFLDLTVGERFKIFENIIQLNKFKEKYDLVDKKKKSLEKELTAIINKRESSLMTLKTIKGYLKDEKASEKKKQEARDAQIAAASARIFEIGSLDNVEGEMISLVDIYKAQLSDAAAYLSRKKYAEGIQANIDSAKRSESSLVDRIARAQQEMKKEPHRCDQCNAIQKIEQYQQNQERLQRDIDQAQEDLLTVQSEMAKLILDHTEQLKLMEGIKNNVQALADKEKTNPLKPAIKKTIYEQVKANKPIAFLEEVKELNAKIVKLREEKIEHVRAIKFVQDIRAHNRTVKQLDAERYAKEKTLDICNIWLSILDIREETSIKQLVIGKIIPAFNSILHENLDDIFNGLMKIQFDTYMNEVIEYEGEESKKSELSTGERARINLCILMSVYELTKINLNASNVLFMDEIFNSMDVYSINKFIRLIKRRYAHNCLVHIVSHSKGVEENLEADQIIKIQRKDRESKIIFL